MKFIDTNVWVYALTEQDHAKKKIAAELISKTYLEDTICVNAQVLKEFANFAFKRTTKSADEINAVLKKMSSYSFVPDTKELVMQAVVLKERYDVGFYDSLMLSAANKAKCDVIYTEDLNSGQKYGTVTAINPFKG